ncbi:UNVERIFIED_CONTAM: Calcineurin-binding protein 1 [Sesamum latifolium]|uniref:Calcineurin-binding protein 1 n=1 Tax=Sesamum latifolium TaxID=2727402 RepID=A0AAW2SQT7_9LAMI
MLAAVFSSKSIVTKGEEQGGVSGTVDRVATSSSRRERKEKRRRRLEIDVKSLNLCACKAAEPCFNENLFKYDLLYNPMSFESWQRLANIYVEEVDLLLNDGSKQINVLGWRKNATLPQRVETSRRRSRRCLLMTLALAKTATQQAELIVAIHDMLAEFGICCARGKGEEQEGTFLKLGIKHLLALDMKLKSNIHSLNKGKETKFDQLTSKDDQLKMSEPRNGEMENNQIIECESELTEDEMEELELIIDNALDQCFYCLYGLNLRSDSSCEEDLVKHKNTSQGDYQTKEQCADVVQYILPYAKA